MPIKNYTSKINPAQSMGEIQAMLAEHKAKRIMIDYDDNGHAKAISFLMMVEMQPLQFRLTVNAEALLKAMEKDDKVPSSFCNLAQAEKTAWRNKMEWLHIQLTEVATGQAEIQELLLGYAITNDGSTVYERLKAGDQKLLQG